jgi:hypothetical protein
MPTHNDIVVITNGAADATEGLSLSAATMLVLALCLIVKFYLASFNQILTIFLD